MFIGFSLAALALVFEPLRDLINSARRGEYYSHIVLIPLVTGYLIYQERKGIFEAPAPSLGLGGMLVTAGLGFYLMGFSVAVRLSENDVVALWTFSALVFWIGGFILLYGWKTFRKNFFPFLFLIFTVPIPDAVLQRIIYTLQVASTEVTEAIFYLSRVPYLREGFVFHLPGVSVEVAEVCSGIRSSLALFITSVLAGHFFLDKFWKKVVLAVIVFPVTIFKNGLRIITLSLLGAYVDPGFLGRGILHTSGGMIFFLPALVLLGVALWILRRQGSSKLKAEKDNIGTRLRKI